MALGDVLGERFEIEQQIRAGGMAEVFRALDRVSGQPVAIKILAEGRELRTARFAREIQLLSELTHPRIVRYVSHGTTSAGKMFLAMEWLDGEDLRTRLEREPLTLGEAVTLVTRVAEALGAAHARGIVHRDLKPGNVFLPDRRVDLVKVFDFGIAQKEGVTQLTGTGKAIGMLGYMAPEQARNSGTIDARADVFSLGCVLFQCVTGTPPFEGDTAVAILGKILFSEAPRIKTLWPEVPDDLDALVARMLAKDPAVRPSDGAELASALTALGPQVHSAAVAPRGRPAPAAALTGVERRFLSVVLLGRAARGPGPAEDALRDAIRPYSGRMENLADGSTIVVIGADGQMATDQAIQAARCALAMRAVAPTQPLVIAMGHAESTRKLPEGDVLDRASTLLSPLAGAAGDQPPIALDEVAAGLLDARFDVVENDRGMMLRGERALIQGMRTLLGRPTSCVGRDWELNALAGIFDNCIDERSARAVIVTAAAGMGKSRLGIELVARLQQRGQPIAIWVGRGDSLRAGSTLDLLGQALRGALGIHGGEPLAERRDRISSRVAERVAAAEQPRVTAFLGEIVGTPFPDDGEGGASLRAARQDAQLMGEQMRRAWMDFLTAETAAHPIVLLLEDLQWGDFGTVRFVEAALRERSDRPWMVLALARPEMFEAFPRLWADHRNAQEIRLKELGRKAAERLVRQVLGDSIGPEKLERVVQQADGNAFYLEELIRAAAEGKDRALPDTVLAMVETRIGRLAIEARRVLRVASVFGELCWEGGVVVLLAGAMGAATVSEWLVRLVEQELLSLRVDSRFPGEREYAFRHSLLREGAYAMLTEDDRKLGHRLAGNWLEQRGESDPIMLAGHFARGGEGERAARYYLRAAEQAHHVLDADATMAHASLGLACSPPVELRMALLGVRCEATAHAWQRISDTMADAEELLRTAPRGSMRWAQGMNAYIEGTMVAGRIGDLRAAIKLLHDVVPAPDAMGKMALFFLGGVCLLDAFGDIAEANAIEQRFRTIIHANGEREPIARFWWNVLVGMRASYAHDDPWTGLQHSNAIRAIYDVTGGEWIFLNMELFRGLNRWYLGALAAGEQVLAAIEGADVALGQASSQRRFGLSWLLSDRGAYDRACAIATQLSEYGHAQRNTLEEGRGRWALAEALRRMGELTAADRELEVARTMVVPLEQPGVLATLSALRLAQGRANEALAAAEDAVARCAAMGGCGMFRGAFVRVVHAEALHATDAHDAARHAISAARKQLLGIAARIGDPQYKQSFLMNVPENAKTLVLSHMWLGDGSLTG